ncbi:hypothetical protein [Staphylococcus equorum]|uniref:hypothetical protein n=1 Tax=Staphylococcus equorum TaxID=246432 RepID=UPI0039AEE6AF
MNDNFKKVIELYNDVERKYKGNMTREMLIDDFFINVGIRDILNLSYEEHKSIKNEEQDENIDYSNTIEKLINDLNLSDQAIKMVNEDYFEQYKK